MISGDCGGDLNPLILPFCICEAVIVVAKGISQGGKNGVIKPL